MATQTDGIEQATLDKFGGSRIVGEVAWGLDRGDDVLHVRFHVPVGNQWRGAGALAATARVRSPVRPGTPGD